MNDALAAIEAYVRTLFRYRIRTEWETRERCSEKGFDKESIEVVIGRMKEEDILNDERFTEMFLYEGLTLKKKGIYVLREELGRLGIPRDKVLVKWQALSLQEDIPALLFRWASKEKTFDPQKWKNKMLRRGFESRDIALALEMIEDCR
ncbi:MAG: RecX family transcriptional regulator [Thermotogae bacterium]|nr:RecX family transcriptional regulator [Thermotogota bacterium]